MVKKAKDLDVTKGYLLIIKFALFVFIILSPVVNFKFLQVLNNIVIKIILLTVIIGMCFVDFQLALIATIAFLILIINLNNNILQMSSKQVDTFNNGGASLLDQQFQAPVQIPKEIDQTQNIVCQNNKKNDINNDLITHYIDDKIKPYEVFIKMMTSDNALEKAQGDHL